MKFELIEIWMVIVGISSNFAGIFQILRLLKEKSSKDVSLANFIVLFHGLIWWEYYGIIKKSLSLILANIIGISVYGVIIYLTIYYRKK